MLQPGVLMALVGANLFNYVSSFSLLLFIVRILREPQFLNSCKFVDRALSLLLNACCATGVLSLHQKLLFTINNVCFYLGNTRNVLKTKHCLLLI